MAKNRQSRVTRESAAKPILIHPRRAGSARRRPRRRASFPSPRKLRFWPSARHRVDPQAPVRRVRGARAARQWCVRRAKGRLFPGFFREIAHGCKVEELDRQGSPRENLGKKRRARQNRALGQPRISYQSCGRRAPVLLSRGTRISKIHWRKRDGYHAARQDFRIGCGRAGGGSLRWSDSRAEHCRRRRPRLQRPLLLR